jgi:hypothetical protein
MVRQVSLGNMPPWFADDSCHPLRDPADLSQDVKDLFSQWKSDGFLPGDERDYHAPKAKAVVELGDPSIVMQPTVPYVTPRTVNDNYRCFLMPSGFDQDTYITAVDIQPGERPTVHHVQIHTIPESSAAQAQALDDADADPGWTCFGIGLPGDYNLFSWRPGGTAATFEPGDAVRVDAGTRVVVQVHYNVQNLLDGEEPPPDLTKVAFWTLPEGEVPDRIIRRAGLFANLDIKPGDAHYVTSQTYSLDLLSRIGPSGTFVPGEVVGETPHMHHLGTRLAVTRTDADGNDTCMIDLPHWNFEWQMDYFYDKSAPVPFESTDSLKVECDYDNSQENQPYAGGVKQLPREITFGEGSYDEMCLNYVWLRYDRDAYLSALKQ